jgi:hypothetical protein
MAPCITLRVPRHAGTQDASNFTDGRDRQLTVMIPRGSKHPCPRALSWDSSADFRMSGQGSQTDIRTAIPRADSRKLADSIRRYGRPERQAHGQRLSRNPHEDGDFQGTERRTCKRLRKFVRSTVVENDLCSPLRTSGQASSENDIFEGPALGIPLPWWWNGPANGAPRSTANLGVYRDMSVSPSGRSSPVGETCRYSVCRVMPSSVQRSLTFVSGLPMDAMASRSFAGVIL